MPADGRGSTGVGRRAPMPTARFEAPAQLVRAGGTVAVSFFGDDGREAVFPVGALPLPGWIEPIGHAFAARIGPAGSIRTRISATGIWLGVSKFVNYLAELPAPPSDPSKLRKTHLAGYEAMLRRSYTSERGLWTFVRRTTTVLRLPPVWDMLGEDARDWVLTRRIETDTPLPPSGYSDGELRRLIARIRKDAAAIRDRIDAGHALVERYEQAPEDIEPQQRDHARLLAEIARTGIVPVPEGSISAKLRDRRSLAMELFLVPSDLIALSALFIVVSDRNLETIKELPAHGRIIEDRAVEVIVTKRRRGPNNWFETVTWEIGPDGQELHHPGGLFLMVQRLTALSRRHSGAERLWALWRNNIHRGGQGGIAEHYDPYVTDLQWPHRVGDWTAGQGLLADPVGDQEPAPLRLDCVRLRKSMEVRRTKQMGGHLPSAARSNTYPVLFSNYLRGDTTVRDWAEDVVAVALTDAEESAWKAHQQALSRAGGHLRVITGPPAPAALERDGIAPAAAERIADGDQDTAWTACADPDTHPETGKPCRATSFLDCFHCGNCVVTRDHLPRLLALLEAMAERRKLLGEEQWWRRYGPTWVAIRRDIIDGRHFSAAEIEQARALAPGDAMLDLVENPWENNP